MAEAPNTNPSPKKRFMSSGKLVSQHREMIASPVLRISLDYALLEYQRRLSLPAMDQIAAAAHFKTAGALEFIDVLMNLAENKEPAEARRKEGIDHTIT